MPIYRFCDEETDHESYDCPYKQHYQATPAAGGEEEIYLDEPTAAPEPEWAVKMKIGKVGKTIYVNAPDAEAAERKALERFKIVEVTRVEKESTQ